ncbi:serine/threonine-protein kinase [Streptomyces sp. YS415]|uniref:serine/threonine-protein kinase n=1 Tax=Streptomyces sp. YS415 TaxID=2944806 RepID=UPI0020206ADA|nr:serine/threonine-protein kinase [Streptomyces sp. YS415]MCL7429817.1 serine/threonine protein kinase [Streptomyces sp. YS415]
MDEVQELLAEYGQWAVDDTASARDRAQQLVSIVADLLLRTVPAAAVQMSETGALPAVFFDFEGRDYLVSCTVDESVVADGTISRIVRDAGLSGRPGDTRWVLLSWAHKARQLDQLIDGIRGFGVVLDRTHLDAAVAGLLPLADLIQDVFRRREPYLPLAELAMSRTARDVPLTMTAADQLTAPVHVPTQTWCGATSNVALVGEMTEAQPSGMAWRAGDSLLVTYEDGLVDLDPVRGRTMWFLTVDGCHGAPIVGPDGAVMVIAGPAVIRWHEGALTAVAGGFEPGAELLAGPGGEPWVLSGSGVTYGAGEGTLALTRVGDTVGTQLRYPVSFEAAVRAATWLDGRRFFLAASGHSAVADLSRTTGLGRQQEWIRSAGHYPGHLLVTGADTVLTASPDGSGNRITLHRTSVSEGSSESVVEYRLDRVMGLTQAPHDGPAYLLASVPDNDPTLLRPVLTRIIGHRPSPGTGQLSAGAHPQPTGYALVQESARGVKKDYALERLPMASGGQAEVFQAKHKASGTVVAFKRRLRKNSGARRRMEREVTVAQRLGGHPHVMPVLDFNPAYDWFVMPMAGATAEEKRTELESDEALRELVDAVAAVLAEAHKQGWVHRDIKPSNILLLNGRWTVADWGIARRPRGETSIDKPLTNASIGSLGWAAPELSTDPHDGSCPASDVYGLGQVIGWILTGTWPQPNIPLLPPPGPWRGVVRQATYRDPAARPQDMAAFIALVERETRRRPNCPSPGPSGCSKTPPKGMRTHPGSWPSSPSTSPTTMSCTSMPSPASTRKPPNQRSWPIRPRPSPWWKPWRHTSTVTAASGQPSPRPTGPSTGC